MFQKMRKTIAMILMLNLTTQIMSSVLPTGVFAADETTQSTQTVEEITRNYEIKDEETWDVSENGDGSVIAKWTRNDRTITISGSGNMKNWKSNSKEDWHNTQYTNLVEKVVIEEGITNMSRNAFYKCSSLESITIPNTVTSINHNAFQGCSKLKNIIIPASITFIGSDTFFECSSLVSIDVDDNNENYSSQNGILFNKDKTIIIAYPAAKKELTEYKIPEGVTTINSGAFSECSSLENIIIPNTVTNISSYAFYQCRSLKNIEIPEKVTYIGLSAFEQCSSLENITIPEGVKTIESSTFNECRSLESITIPNTVTSINDNAFQGCSKLKNIIIPSSISVIKSGAFYECNNLKTIVIPSEVTSIENSAFYKCGLLIAKADSEAHRYAEENKHPYILEGIANNLNTIYEVKKEETWDVSENGDNSVIAKWTRDDRTIVISGIGSMKKWDLNSKEDWHNTQYGKILKNVVIENGITNIDSYAFQNCSNLESITIPEGVTKIGYEAFVGCSSLKNIIIPNSVAIIERYAFSICSSLENIIIPSSVISIGEDAFNRCNSLQSINVNKDNKFYLDEDGILFNKNKTKLIKYPAKKQELTEYKIPQGVTSIGRHAFYECSSLKNIIIPNTVKDIGIDAFVGCSSLEKMIIPDGVTSIENWLFLRCSNLKSIMIPEGVTSIGWWAFGNCSSLESITIPKSVTNIQSEAFSGCTKLESIMIPETVTNIRIRAIDKSTIIYCKENSEAHRYAEESEQGYIITGDKGDINKDGQINTSDMIKILRYLAVNKNQAIQEKYPTWKLNEQELVIADINEDGKVNTTDLLKVLRHMAAVKDSVIAESHPDWMLK